MIPISDANPTRRLPVMNWALIGRAHRNPRTSVYLLQLSLDPLTRTTNLPAGIRGKHCENFPKCVGASVRKRTCARARAQSPDTTDRSTLGSSKRFAATGSAIAAAFLSPRGCRRPAVAWQSSEATGCTTLEGVYAAGDDVHGADLIVTAIAAGRQAAQAMDAYLRSLPSRQQTTQTRKT